MINNILLIGKSKVIYKLLVDKARNFCPEARPQKVNKELLPGGKTPEGHKVYGSQKEG